MVSANRSLRLSTDFDDEAGAGHEGDHIQLPPEPDAQLTSRDKRRWSPRATIAFALGVASLFWAALALALCKAIG